MIADVLISVGEKLFDAFMKLKDKKIQKSARIADLFSELALTIEKTSAYLKKGDYPHGMCEELRTHAEQMEDTIDSAVGKAKAADYAKRVLEVWEIEKVYGELDSLTTDAEREALLNKLDRAAGYFRAVSAHVRIA
ncbi:MAG TPA: hypothetical protein DDX98_11300 [Bacteroidales bacterium]|jgi:hypothetical protein|nr:hypothetical protein [Bacteroidales bacterium]